MSHPLDEDKDSNWGRGIVHQIEVLKADVEDVSGDVVKMKLELRLNTEKTNSIKADTQWLVDMFRGGRVWGRFLIGLAAVLVAIAAIGVWLGHK